jgi:hypothetical protein
MCCSYGVSRQNLRDRSSTIGSRIGLEQVHIGEYMAVGMKRSAKSHVHITVFREESNGCAWEVRINEEGLA